MSLTLYSYPGNPRAFKALIAAQYAGVKIDVPAFKMGVDNKTKEFLSEVNPLGKVPALKTADGSIFESNAIARYVARLGTKSGLYGTTPLEGGQVDQWIDFATNEIELPANAWTYPILGAISENKQLTQKAQEDVSKVMSILDKHLLYKTFLVGERVTLADIVVACTLYLPFVLVFDAKFLAPFGNVLRWFNTLIHQTQFQAVMGDVKLCTKQRFAGDGLGYAPASSSSSDKPKEEKKKEEKPKEEKKKEEKPKEEKKKEEKPKEEKKKEEKPKEEKKKEEKPKEEPAHADEEEEEEAPKPKVKNALDLLPPSPFILDEFKRLYSNSKNIRAQVFPELWAKFDKEGWVWYHCSYKFNDELQKLYMVSNLVSGFLQRLDELRKYGFGNMLIFGDEAKGMKVSGCWMFRGQDVPPMMNDCDDSAWYEWKKLNADDAADRALIEDYMVWAGKFGGKEEIEATDGKTFK
eukprot:c4545_g1_i1.p1 GENE.c4545_g1_i1~~c4545_g1_i1.p1  ORF type:complete len:465 (-),score=62.67 c4545_g1_i1:101-1495(-)